VVCGIKNNGGDFPAFFYIGGGRRSRPM
jgi:hypothetical protein